MIKALANEESDDMFQTESFSGGYDAGEKALCPSQIPVRIIERGGTKLIAGAGKEQSCLR